ncbi:MAG: DUF262 domain-containing protein [Bacteroidaceae bacterium]|nr:DUF262 domain-containing protein [Bacteroidaceae bacterium]MEA5099201.1 DUF262 domain-containing protein [Bacteroidales bacterium]NCC18407.1 DUF262 domain-containing protein [Bacteroidia bacterium]
MQQTITPDRQTVESCLKQKTYYIDFYQREYVWEKKTVEILLNDIFYNFELSYEEHKDDDLSPELMEKFNWYYLNIFITNNVKNKIYIVDGQQRLSTLTLIAAKLYHMTEDGSLKDILKECVFTKDKWRGNIFCLDNEKRKDVMECILDKSPYLQSLKNKTEKNLIERYQDISDYLDLKNMDSKKLKTFISYFLEKLILVELSIDKEDTPMIFEVINDRGEALKPFEILKGKIIGALSKDDTDKYSEIWENAISILFEKEDDFLIDYIKSKYIYKRNSKIEIEINNAYHRYIFNNNEIANNLKFRRKDKGQIVNIKKFINEDLTYYSHLYAKIRKNNYLYLRYNNEINSLSGQYQNILAACRINDPFEDDKIKALSKEIDRLYVLLKLNGIYDSNSFQEISYRINKEMANVSIDKYREIFNGIIIETIKERRSLQTVTTVLDYETFLKRDYSNMDTRTLRYFLARIEDYVCCNINQTMQNDVFYISTKTGDKSGYHIEHILSRNETNKSYFENEEEFETKRNLLGGLLLLKDRSNISSGNEEYENKLKTYSNSLVWGHTLCDNFYHCNKDFEDFNLRLQQDINNHFEPIDRFDKDALDKRSRLLYDLVKLIWEI